MNRRGLFSPLRWFSIFFILAALVLSAVELTRYSRVRANFPSGMKIAGVPVGGVDRQEAAQRLLAAYTVPVELYYDESPIQMNPALVDFQLQLDDMLAAADLQRAQQPFWVGYWDYLWGRASSPQEIPLRSSYSETRLRNFLEGEIAQRYDQPPVAAQPVVGTVNFQAGIPGTALDIDGSVL
ncbi:MAG: hypothetical protein KAS36_17065, partial [Anaerolineales bacterium]|nr:hypothetical protein [Anaerolineales bacterium]